MFSRVSTVSRVSRVSRVGRVSAEHRLGTRRVKERGGERGNRLVVWT
jgi:hypothetical protein